METLGAYEGPVDDFVVGNRVYVSGTKKGKIAFLGETRFAPGEWAGVVLDEPVGKNDGTVSGVRYFTCEPFRGIFCKIDKLSHCNEPVCASPSRSSFRVPTSPSRSSFPHVSSLATNSPRPVDRDSGEVFWNGSNGVPEFQQPVFEMDGPRSEVSNGSNKGQIIIDFSLGERVVVSNTTRGWARYIGETRFASGIWVGVELDEAIGKNDGSVNGVRYFSCQPCCGLFAPYFKVRRLTDEVEREIQAMNSDPNAIANTRSPLMSPNRAADVQAFPAFAIEQPDTQRNSLPVSHSAGRLPNLSHIQRNNGQQIPQSGSRESLASVGASSVCSSASRPGASQMKAGGRNSKPTANYGKQSGLAYDSSRTPNNNARLSGTYAPAIAPGKQAYLSQQANPGSARSNGGGDLMSASMIGGGVTPSNTAMQKVLREQDQHIEALQRELHDEQHELAKQTARADSLDRRVNELAEELSKMSSEYASVKVRLHEEQKRIEELEFELAEHEITADGDENGTSALGNADSNAEKLQKAELELELRNMKEALEKAEMRNNEMRKSLDEAHRGWNDSRDSCAAYIDEIDRLRSDLANCRKEAGPSHAIAIATGQRDLPTVTVTSDDSNCERCVELTERVAALELRLRTSERERCEYVEKKRALQAENGDLRSRLASADEEILKLQTRLAEAVEQRTIESQRRSESERLRTALQAQLDEICMRYEVMREKSAAGFPNATDSISNGLHEDAANCSSIIADLRGKLNRLGIENEAITAEHNDS